MFDLFDTIILLTGDLEEQVFASLLLTYNMLLSIVPVGCSNDLCELAPELLQRARLIGFATSIIVPKEVLDQIGFGAYNFHPGPPSYPGWAPAIFAISDNASEFGATVHRMNERVDEGQIVATTTFPVPPEATVTDLEALSYSALVGLFRQLAPSLATLVEPLAALPIPWSGEKCTRRAFAAICNLPLEIPAAELRAAVTAETMRILNCTAVDFGHPPPALSTVDQLEQSPGLAGGEADSALRWSGDQALLALSVA